MPRYLRPFILAGLFALSASFAQAQSVGRAEQTETNIRSYHKFVQPGAATVQVYVMGTVGATGLYEISEGTDLGKLLALTGGPTFTQTEDPERRRVIIRLFRTQAGTPGQKPLYEATFEEVIAHPEAYPTLRDGDVLTVETITKSKFNWLNALRLVNAGMIFFLTADRLSEKF